VGQEQTRSTLTTSNLYNLAESAELSEPQAKLLVERAAAKRIPRLSDQLTVENWKNCNGQ